MDFPVLDPDQWAAEHFGACELGDQRRTKRLVKYVGQVAACSEGSTPNQTESWADCKAAYRLFDEEDVSFEAVCRPHWNRTKNRDSGVFLLLGDTTEIDFGYDPDVEGLSPVGSGNHRGFHLHSSLMIDAETEEVIGSGGGRDLSSKTQAEGGKDSREKEPSAGIGSLGPRDRSGRKACGTGEVYSCVRCGGGQLRSVLPLETARCGLGRAGLAKTPHRLGFPRQAAGTLGGAEARPSAGLYKLSLRSRKNQPAREALLEVRFAAIEMPIPAQPTPYMRACGLETIPMFAVHVREIAPPEGVEPLDWILLTSETVECFEEAWTVIGYYEKRWRVEDYHKCLKTGCQVESRQYKTSDRLERVTGVLSIVAVRLLQLKFAARCEPSPPAEDTVPPDWIEVLKQVRNINRPIETAKDFLREVAKLGGFLGRKSDGDPGWITIWRGFNKLILCLRGVQWTYEKCG